MTGKPTDSLAHQFARRGNFRQLWQLAREMPLERAVGLMPLFADWRPHDAAGRALFGRLAATRPQAVAAAAAELRAAAATDVRIRIRGRDAVLGDVAFAPDVSQVAALGSYFSRRGYLKGNGPEYRRIIDVFALPGGRRVDRLPTARDTRHILHLGDSILEVAGDVLPTRVTLRTGRRHKLLWGTTNGDHRDGDRPDRNGDAAASPPPGDTRDGFAVAGTGVTGGQLSGVPWTSLWSTPGGQLSGGPWTSQWSTPGGECTAVRGTGTGGLRILDLRLSAVEGLVSQPVGGMRPADLTTVTAAARSAATPAVRDLLDLLRACLEYRWTAQPASGES